MRKEQRLHRQVHVLSALLLGLVVHLLLEVLNLHVGRRVFALKHFVARVNRRRGLCWRKILLVFALTDVFSDDILRAEIFKLGELGVPHVASRQLLRAFLDAEDGRLVAAGQEVELNVNEAGCPARQLLHQGITKQGTFGVNLLRAGREGDHWKSLEWA